MYPPGFIADINSFSGRQRDSSRHPHLGAAATDDLAFAVAGTGMVRNDGTVQGAD
jgi:hypothetical protein